MSSAPNSTSLPPIPLMRPLLPNADAVLPYLRQIDENRWYSNFGPLVDAFEQRLAKCLGVPWKNLVCVTSGTMGLSVALRTRARAPSGYCLMPSWTFTASAGAARAAGLEPYFLDVSSETWALDPKVATKAVARIEANGVPVAAIMPVSPFGAVTDSEAWSAFEADTGVPVVIDAAAAFDSTRFGAPVSVISLHATKVFGIGEGAVVVSQDEARIAAIRSFANFGFEGTRESRSSGVNAKISEYAAAIGLAALDQWPEKRTALRAVIAAYATGLSGMTGVTPAPGFETGAARSTCDIQLSNMSATTMMKRLGAEGIETRQWWGQGCHLMPAYAHCFHEPLPVTRDLGEHVLGLPMSIDLSASEVNRICAAVDSAVNG